MKVSKIYRKDINKKYGVRWTLEGKHKYKFFENEKDRNHFHRKLLDKQKTGQNAVLRLSAHEAVTAERCINMLGSIDEIYKICLEHHKRITSDKMMINQAIIEYFDFKERSGKDQKYLRAIRNILRRFNSAFACHVDEVTFKQAQEWILSLNGFSPYTIKNHETGLNVFYNWCIKHNYAVENPFLKVETPKVTKNEVEFILPEDMKKIMEIAKAKYRKAIPYLVLNGFAGIRSSACADLPFEDIKLEQKGILIKAQLSKNNRRTLLTDTLITFGNVLNGVLKIKQGALTFKKLTGIKSKDIFNLKQVLKFQEML